MLAGALPDPPTLMGEGGEEKGKFEALCFILNHTKSHIQSQW